MRVSWLRSIRRGRLDAEPASSRGRGEGEGVRMASCLAAEERRTGYENVAQERPAWVEFAVRAALVSAHLAASGPASIIAVGVPISFAIVRVEAGRSEERRVG